MQQLNQIGVKMAIPLFVGWRCASKASNAVIFAWVSHKYEIPGAPGLMFNGEFTFVIFRMATFYHKL
jgi:hypothetical protein